MTTLQGAIHVIDFRNCDQHGHGMTLDERLNQPVFNLEHAQRIREQMRAQGLRIPLTDAEEFAAAERRMRSAGGR